MGLRAKGLVSDKQRVGALEEKETIGYVLCVPHCPMLTD